MFSCTEPAHRKAEWIFILYPLTCHNYLLLKNDDFSILARNFPLLNLNIISSHPLYEVTELNMTLTLTLFENPHLFLSTKACRVRGGKTSRLPDFETK